jgi:3-hydroxyacyl-CoA dehydrogenase/3a,7a,12a-trihydroxy-5b-cholest-24-enoyl-CoA hydratase
VAFYVESHPELVQQIQTIFQFKLAGPDSVWTIDLKNDKGSVKAEPAASPDVTLELSDADFLGMSQGKLNPQKLYFGGKLKISGNVMASQKLEFLQKVDPEKVKEAMRKAGRLPGGAGQGAPAAAAPPAAPGRITGGDIFIAIRDYIEKNPDLAGSVATVFQFNLKNPDSSWVIDLKNAKGSVSQGTTGSADVTLDLSDDDFLAMTSGAADPQKLFLTGKLKITGNVMASQKLMFLKKIDPTSAKAAIEKARSGGAPAAAAGSAPSAPQASAAPSKKANAPAIMKSLGERLAKTPGLGAEVGALVQFNIKDPASAFTVDLRGEQASISEGTAKDAAVTFTLADEDLAALAKGQSAEDLHQRGRLRVDGEVRLAHKLSILKDLL